MSELIERLAVAGKRRTNGPTEQWPQAGAFELAMAVLADDYLAVADEDARSDRLDMLALTFGLDLVDAALLWSVVAADLDASIALAYGALRGIGSAAAVSIGLALELSSVPTNSREAWTRLSPNAPLRRHALLEVTDGETWLSSTLRVPNTVTATLAGAGPNDPQVARMRCSVTPLPLPGGHQVRRALEQGEPLIWVHAGPGAAGTSMAAGAVAATGRGCLAIDARRYRGGSPGAVAEPSRGSGASGVSISRALARAARDAGLRGQALIVVGGERLAEAAATGRIPRYLPRWPTPPHRW